MAYKIKHKDMKAVVHFTQSGERSGERIAFFKTKKEIDNWLKIRKEQGWKVNYRIMDTPEGKILYIKSKD